MPSKSTVLSALIGLAVVIGLPAASYIQAYNLGNQHEQGLNATLKNNQNILSQYGQKVLEAAQVSDLMRDDILAVTKQTMEGRYGADGARAAFQMITEQNPQVSPDLYLKLQQIIEAGRTEYQNGQTRMIDQRRVFETDLNSFYTGFWLRMAGYPKVNLETFNPITTSAVDTIYQQGKETGPIQLRPQK